MRDQTKHQKLVFAKGEVNGEMDTIDVTAAGSQDGDSIVTLG